MTIADISLLDLLPSFMREDGTSQAFAAALDPLLRDIARQAVTCNLYAVQDLPEPVLDELAGQYLISWYDSAASTVAKRALIQGAYEMHSMRGTPEAVLNALKAVYGNGMLEEWFKYGGTPYHFRVYTTDASALYSKRAEFMALVEKVKNLRSVIDNVIYYGAEGSASVFVATACVGMEACATATAI